jgi:hypothetical protein
MSIKHLRDVAVNSLRLQWLSVHDRVGHALSMITGTEVEATSVNCLVPCQRSVLGLGAALAVTLAAASPAVAQCDYRTAVLADNPVAYWRLGEATGTIAKDEVGPGPNGAHPGVYVGAVQLGQAGSLSGDSDASIFLNGSGARMEVPDDPALNFVGAPFSIEAWVKKSTSFGAGCGSNCMKRIVDKSRAGFGDGYGLDMDDSSIRTLGSVNAGAGNPSVTGIPFDSSVGQWYHIVTVSDGSGHATTFVNGVSIGTYSYASTNPWRTALRVGAPDVAGSAYFVGWIDEVAIYNHMLTQQQVSSHYNARTSSLRIVAQPSSAAVCQASTATFVVSAVASGTFTYHWRHNGIPLDSLANPSAATATLTLTNVQAADTGSYDCVVTNACGSVTSNAADLDVYCDCPDYSVTAGSIDNFALPADQATRSASFTDALNNQNQRAFLKFDEMPGVTTGTVGDQNIAQSFTSIPADLLSATLTIRAKSGPDNNPGAEGTDRMRLGFASGGGNNAAFDIRWERFFGIGNATDAFLPGVAWGGSIDRTIALDLTALPKASQQGGGTINVLPQMIASETLDFVVDDDSAVDYMQLTGVRSGNGQKVAWVRSQPADQYACLANNESFSVTAAGTGPFTYEWRKDGVAIDLGANPSAATATLTLTNVQTSDVGAYNCIVTGACGSVTSNAATLTVCAGDINCDEGVDFGDFLAFFNCYDAETPCADIDGNPGVDFGDFLAFFNAYDVGC